MDINQVITLGIGTPASIEHFVLFGLSPNPNVLVAEPHAEVCVPWQVRTVTVAAHPQVKVPFETRTVTVRRPPRCE